MSWISRASGLNEAEMKNNADIVINTYRSVGIEDRVIAAILGNMQNESSVNPERVEAGGGGGYGLVQWTPQSVLENHCISLGLSPFNSGDIQLKVILSEIRGESGTNEWYTTEAFISNYYDSGATADMIGITGEQFLSNDMNWNTDKLALMFMVGYERPTLDPSSNHAQKRMQDANTWYSYIQGISNTYEPRLDSNGMEGSIYWYSNTNPFYPTYGLPNCTCYAWGRFWEISDTTKNGSNIPKLPTGNAGTWYDNVLSSYSKGNAPKLGAVACFSDNDGGPGHVAIVEKIDGDTITVSQSNYGGAYFETMKLYKSNGYTYPGSVLQGFIYNPFVNDNKPPKPFTKKKKRFNFVLFNQRRRNLQNANFN